MYVAIKIPKEEYGDNRDNRYYGDLFLENKEKSEKGQIDYLLGPHHCRIC